MGDYFRYLNKCFWTSLYVWEKAQRVSAFIAFLLAVGVAYFATRGIQITFSETGLLFALVVLGAWFLILMIFVTPFRLYRELSNEVTILKKSLNERAITSLHVQTLTVLRERGAELAAERITLEQYSDWLQRVERWELLTMSYLANYFTHQDAVDFKFVNYTYQLNIIYKVSAEHGHKIIEIMARDKYLKAIIERYPTSWSPITTQNKQKVNQSLSLFEAQTLAANRDQALH